MPLLTSPSRPATSIDSRTDVRVRVVTDPELLRAELPAWRDLVHNAAEPNAFYEPWFFRPAAREFGRDERWRLTIVESTSQGEATWLGFFPLVHKSGSWFGEPSHLSLWNHPYCFLTAPLVRSGAEGTAVEALFANLRHDPSVPGIIRFPKMTAMGPIQQALVDTERQRLLTRYVRSSHNRALLSSTRWGPLNKSAADLVAENLGGHHVREMRRQRRRLSEHGEVTLRVMQNASQVGMWVDWFLELEDSGWKGRVGSSMKQHSHESAFFREMVTAGFRDGRMEMLGLFCQGEPIAMKCNLLADAGSFSFKIAFKDELGRFSPGVQLELDHIARFMDSGREWMDSCAAAEHKMINRLWADRRTIQDLSISTGRAGSDLLLASLPLLRVLFRQSKECVTAVKQLNPFPLNTSTSSKS